MNTSFNINAEKDFKYQLENVIDSKGLSYVLNCITEICEGKAEHLAENWQDEKTAKMWTKTASKIDSFRLKIENICPLF